MSEKERPSDGAESPSDPFATTRWSIVVRAGRRNAPDADEALAILCESYWYPLYVYARRRGRTPHDARDLTQEFFARLLEKDFLHSADPQRGRFRAFLLTAFKRFLASEHERQQAQKRGGGRKALSLDLDTGEDRYQYEPTDAWTAERLFERRWALTLLERVMQQLGEEYAAGKRVALFQRLQRHLTGAPDAPSYAETAEALGMLPGAVRVAVHRMRQRYRQLLQCEVAQTLGPSEDVEAEIAHLRAAMRGDG